MSGNRIYRVTFFNQGSVYEVYARQVMQGGLYGFIEVEGLLFNEKTKLVIDPAEDRLKQEFEGVSRFHIPMHAVVRIDEVEREGTARITPPSTSGDGAKVSPFPAPIYTKDPGKS
jgi:hypothetical protein